MRSELKIAKNRSFKNKKEKSGGRNDSQSSDEKKKEESRTNKVICVDSLTDTKKICGL